MFFAMGFHTLLLLQNGFSFEMPGGHFRNGWLIPVQCSPKYFGMLCAEIREVTIH